MAFKNYLYSSKRALCRLLPGATFSVLIAAFFLFTENVAFAQTPFTCQNGVSYQIQGNPSALYQIDLRTGTATSLLTAAALGNRNLTGLGYNPTNNFLYASVSGTNTILRIGASGTPTLITVPTLPALAYTAGDVGPDGSMYLYVSSSVNIYKVNLNTLAVTTLTITDGATLSDFSVSPDGTTIYGISGNNGNLVSYATTGGARTTVAVGMPSGILNSSFMDSNNNLYVIQDDNSQVYEIVGPNKSPNATTATQLTTSSTAIANTDGARCITSTATTQTPFICAAGTGFVVSGALGYSSGNCTDLGNSILSTYNLASNTVTSVTSQLINSFNSRTTVNNLGYNTKDNYLWGYRNGTNQLVRIGAGPSVGTVRAVDYFAIDGLSTTCAYTFGTTNNSVFIAGDINTNGIMYLFNGFDGDRFVRVDLNPASSTYLQKLSDIVLTPANLTPAGGAPDFADIAFNPIDGNLYAVNANQRLIRINPTSGVITDVGAVTGLTNANTQNFLITFFDNSGALYVQQGQSSILYKIPNVAANNLAGSVQTTGAQSVGGNGDGARCPLSSIETYTLSGTVFNDANGLLGTPANTIDGTPVSALNGNTLSVNLVNPTTGLVLRTTTLTAGGTYSFTGVSSNTSYSIVLTNTPGVVANDPPSTTLTGVANTGEFIGTGAGSDGNPNGVISVSVATSSIANINFGIDRLPVADAKSTTSVPNPGGTVRVSVPTLTGSDAEDGTYTGVSNTNTIVIQSLPGAAGTLYYNNAVVTLGQVITNYNPTLLFADPADGPVSVTFTYSERDAAGKDSPPALVTIPFSDALISISGTVFNDANGLLGTPANTVDGTPVSTLVGNTFRVSLVGPAGTVVASTSLTSGTYSFTGITPNASYSVVLSNTAGTVGSAPPSTTLTGSVVNTGENIGSGAGSDGNPNGIIAVPVTTNNVTNVNFGVDRLPTADPKTASTVPNPGGTNRTTVPTLTGSDPEDGNYTGVTNTNTIVIQTLPSNGTLYYSNSPVTLGQVIPNYNPTLLMIDPIDGPVSVTFTYSERDAAGKDSPTALVTMSFSDALVAISGTVFNDANGLLGTPANTVDGTPVNTLAGNTFYANLVSATTGNVVASTTLTSGTYSFTGVSPNASYSVVLSNTAGTVGSAPPSTTLTGSVVNTGEFVGSGAGSDGNPNGIVAVAVTTSNVTNVNFGVDRLPTADPKTASSVPNPGGTNRVTVPTLTGSDPEDGTYTGVSNTNTIVIQTLPGATGTLYYSTSAVTVGQVITNYNPALLTLDPADGPVTVTFTYSERDAAGKDSPAALVTIPFSNALVSISGTVYNDANGLLGTPANTVDGTPVNTLAGNTFYANLVSAATGNVVASTTLTSGTYSFTGITPNASYSVVLSNTAGTVGSAPPSTTLTGSVVNTGEFVGSGAGSDGNPNGIVAVTVTTSNVANVNFGVDRLPTADPKTASSQSNPGGTNRVTVPTLTGSDPEDGNYTGVSNTNTIVIQSLPGANGTLYYSTSAVTVGQVITNYNPTLLTVDPADGPVTVTFTYSERDAAGKDSPVAQVTMPFSDALVTISGTVFNDANGLLGTPANTVDGTPVSTLAGNTFYANLVSATTGNVLASTTLTSGTYSFTGVTPFASYSVVLSNTAGTVGSPPPSTTLTGLANTGEFVGSGAGSDGNPNGIVAVTVTTSNVANVNFGVDRLPTADPKTAASQVNPGGNNTVTVPTLTGSDPEDGNYTGVSNTNTIVIQALPSAALGVIYYSNSPVTVGQVITNYTPALLTVGPATGPVSVTFTYSERDAAGKDSPPALVTMPFTDALVAISGTVYNDANGLLGTPANTVDGTPVSSLAGNTFYVSLVSAATGNVVASTTLTSGTYSFTGVSPNTSYSVVLSNTAGTVGSAPPSTTLTGSVVNTGENIGTAAGNDGNPNGIIAVAVTTNGRGNVNFGVDRLPVADAKSVASVPNPGGTNRIAAPTLTGSDPEDGNYTGVSNTNTVIIQALPSVATGILYYSNSPVTVGQVITNYNPTLLTVDPIDGPVSMTFTYSERDAAGKDSPPALVTIPFSDALVAISGTVFNDANGLLGTPANTVDGTPVNTLAGNTFYANLVSATTGNVVASTTLTSGTYSFTGVSPNASYSVVLSNTAGTVGSAPPSTTLTGSVVNTGEFVGSGAGSDGNPNGIVAVTVTTSNVANVNFGVDRLPTADPKTASSVPNPGGTNRVTVPTLTGSDPEDGTYTGVSNTNTIVIQTLPGATGTLYYNNVAVTVGQVITNYNPTLLTLDPADGPVNVTFTYSEQDAAGKNSPPALVTMPFSDALVAISGTVYNDANGLLGTPANTVDGTPVSTLAGNTFYANLVNATTGNVVASTTLTSGTYSFTGVTPNASYSVVLTNSAGVVGSAPPSTTLTGVVNTGENLGSGAGSDGNPNGIIALLIANSNVTNVNFGVDRLPTADPKTASSQNNPGGTSTVVVPTLTGSDPEDGTYTGVSNTNTIVIQTLPGATGTLYYNNVAVTAGQVITNYNPTLLTVDPADGPLSVTFTYSERDAAGKDSPAALVTMPFTAIPDLAPIIYALPATQYNTTNTTVVVDVFELNNVSTTGLITVVISKDPLVNLAFNPNATFVGGRPVNNNIWTFNNTNPNFYIFTTNQVIDAGDVKSIGMTGVTTPGNTRGVLTISTTIVGGSGGENRIDNNSDADKIDYFNK